MIIEQLTFKRIAIIKTNHHTQEDFNSLVNLVKELRAEIQSLKTEVLFLSVENKKLKAENAELKIKLTSRNSSIPPSKDITRIGSTKSIRKSLGKKQGGQDNHEGHNLKYSKTPDEVVDCYVTKCDWCNADIAVSDQTEIDRQQVIDLPLIRPVLTEYVKYMAICPQCNGSTMSNLPIKETKCKVQYGEQIRSLITYLNTRQVISINRVQELFSDVFNIKISGGTIANMVSESATKMTEAYDQIKHFIQSSKILGADETSCNISGENNWLWSYQNNKATYLYIHPTRGTAAIESQFPTGFKKATLITDRWAAQLKTKSKDKQLCLQHLVRDAQKLIDSYSSTWARQLQKVLYEIIQLTHSARIKVQSKQDIEERIDRLLDSPLTNSEEKIKKLQASLFKNRNAITTCLYDRAVPPTNNGTEQSIRKMKIKMKIAGCFRSQNGGQSYAIIQSIIDTGIKRGVKPILAIQNPSIIFA